LYRETSNKLSVHQLQSADYKKEKEAKISQLNTQLTALEEEKQRLHSAKKEAAKRAEDLLAKVRDEAELAQKGRETVGF
jgi:predicted transcriptional regulator